jgi:macrolide transport system ATP-binding/permease protein
MPSLLSYQAIVSMMALAIAGLMLRSGPVREASTIKRSVADLTAVVLDAQGLNRAQYQMLIADTSERLAAVSGGQRVAGIAGQMQAGISQTLKVTADYFDVVHTPWMSGRTFGPSDPRDHVMVVNEAFARRFWPGKDAIGQILSAHDVWDPGLVGRQVVGVVGNTQLLNPTAYVPAQPGDVRVLLVRAPPQRISREVAPFIVSGHPSVSVDILSGPAWIATAFGPSMIIADVTMYFGAVALMLGAVGLFSFMQFSVQQRTGEIALRRALGAQAWDVVRSVIEPAARPLCRALLLGSAGAGCVGVFMRKAELPAGINPLDAVTYAGVAGAMSVAFLLAAYGPARRAITTEPNELLRSE